MEKEEKSRDKEIDGCCIVFTCQMNATAWHDYCMDDGWHLTRTRRHWHGRRLNGGEHLVGVLATSTLID